MGVSISGVIKKIKAAEAEFIQMTSIPKNVTSSHGSNMTLWPSGHGRNAGNLLAEAIDDLQHLQPTPTPTPTPGPSPPPAPTPTPPPTPPDPSPANILTGGHFVGPRDFATMKAAGWGFVIAECQPQDTQSLQAILDGLATNNLYGIVNLYPEPYVRSGDSWTITAAGKTALKALAADSNVLAVFAYNEPYWVGKLTILQLTNLRNTIQSVAPGLKVYHDIGSTFLAVNGGDEGTDDQSGVCDYAGVWYYPFEKPSSYNKSAGLAWLADELDNMASVMPNTGPVFLGQVFQDPSGAGTNTRMPTSSEVADWSKAIRDALPDNALISWYTWGVVGGYVDTLSAHPDYLPSTIASD